MSNSCNGIDRAFYDEAYYEHGPMYGKSLYSYYRWMPEPTFRMGMAIIEYAGLERNDAVLDFGCAKGFLVKAFRYLFRDAYGCDWSEYAIKHIEEDVRDYVILCTPDNPLPFTQHFRLCVAKDVLEHVPYGELPQLLRQLRNKTDRLMVVVPLGKNQKYVIEEYERDKSHVIREDKDWWLGTIEDAGFSIASADYHISGVKDSWHKVHPRGNFVVLAE